MGMSLNLNAGSPAERVVLALAILGLVLETFADDVGCNKAPVMDMETCEAICQPRGVHRLESYACECEPWPDAEECAP